MATILVCVSHLGSSLVVPSPPTHGKSRYKESRLCHSFKCKRSIFGVSAIVMLFIDIEIDVFLNYFLLSYWQSNFDTCSVKRICSSGENIFPIRWQMCHICHSNPVIPTITRIVRTFLSAEQKAKLMLHNGSTETVLESLANNHLTRECLPVELGEPASQLLLLFCSSSYAQT